MYASLEVHCASLEVHCTCTGYQHLTQAIEVCLQLCTAEFMKYMRSVLLRCNSNTLEVHCSLVSVVNKLASDSREFIVQNA